MSLSTPESASDVAPTSDARPTLMPAAFFGHGNPMNAIETNRFTSAWKAFGASVPRPRAILVVSAHWYINATAVTAMPDPRTIHDFYGFPQELFDVQYPAPGLPGLVEEISDVVHPTWVGADVDSWGIDHGTWSVLTHAFPDASIPVVQMSINADKPLDYHLNLGAALAPLREQGVLIVTSGNIVHNLRSMDWKQTDAGFDWARRFNEDAKERMMTDPTEMPTLDAHADWGLAVPTPDHFIPSLYLAGLAGAAEGSGGSSGSNGSAGSSGSSGSGGGPEAPGLDVLVDGYSYGSLSMTAYTLGMTCPASDGEGGSSAPPAHLPPDGSNI